MLEPSDSSECKEFARMAYDLSEQFDTPVILRLSTRVSHSQSMVELGEPRKQQLKEYVKSHMATHKTPRYVDFVDEFPMNGAGKILKYKMREQAVNGVLIS